MRSKWYFLQKFSLISSLLLLSLALQNEIIAGELQIIWTDNSNNENGFSVERKTGTGGTFAQITTVGAGISSYTDLDLVPGTTYCYRLRAFNAAGNSAYSNENCAPARPTVNDQTFALSVTKAGNGTVTSAPAGINCGTDCSENYPSGTSVKLTVAPLTGSTFAGWSGNADCSDGSVTMNANKNCIATFNVQTPNILALTVTKAGTGTVTSSPSGINCGSDCSELYNHGTIVTLTATPGAGSSFSGWSGGGCNGTAPCRITLTATTNVGAQFQTVTSAQAVVSFTLINANTGQPIAAFDPIKNNATLNLATLPTRNLNIRAHTNPTTVGSVRFSLDGNANFRIENGVPYALAGDDSGKYKSWTPSLGTHTLTATPYTGSKGQGSAGTPLTITFNVIEAPSNVVTLQVAQAAGSSAAGELNLVAGIGILRPNSGEWYLDLNGNGMKDACGIDGCLGPFGREGDLPVADDWSGSGANIGIFRPRDGRWYLDLNGSGTWDGCTIDGCLGPFGETSDLPIAGDWTSSGKVKIGVFRPGTGEWFLDINSNGKWEGCIVDRCLGPYGQPGDLPIVGDWTGKGIAHIGVFRPGTGEWFLDINGNGKWKGCKVDRCLGPYGQPGDLPVVGDWTGKGMVHIGFFRPDSGEWFFDINGNGRLDNCDVDACLGPFGKHGDLPIVGKW